MAKSSKVKPIPEGFRTITPMLSIRDAAGAIDFYQRAFGAETINVMRLPDGKVMHAELVIGDSRLFVGEEMPGMGQPSPSTLGGTCAGIHLYVKDVDQAFARAVEAGATVRQPLADQFWGDRFGAVVDPYGHAWSLGTRKENLSHEEMNLRGLEFVRQMAEKSG